jgi:hypothetical protein
MMSEATGVRYLVLPDRTNPYLLARVRWPDVAQAISAGCPDWQDDVGLFDLPYDGSGVPVTPAEATAIAVGWGAQLPSETAVRTSGPRLIRRMPANWSDLSPAERRAWSLESVISRRRADRTRSRFRVALATVASRLIHRPDPLATAPPATLPVRLETWDPMIESIPSIVLPGPADAVADRPVSAVFSRMESGSTTTNGRPSSETTIPS